MFFYKINNVRNNNFLYDSEITDFKEIGDKPTISQSPPSNFIWDFQRGSGIAQSAGGQIIENIKVAGQLDGIDLQGAIQAEIETLKAKLAADIESGKTMAFSKTIEKLVGMGLNAQQINHVFLQSGSASAAAQQPVEYGRLLTQAKKDALDTHAPSAKKFKGTLLSRIEETTSAPLAELPMPTGFKKGFFYNPKGVGFDGNASSDFYGEPLKEIDYDDYYRDSNGAYVFIKEGNTITIPKESVYKAVDTPGNTGGLKGNIDTILSGFRLVPETDSNGDPVLDANGKQNYVMGEISRQDYNQYFIQADIAHELKNSENSMNFTALTMHNVLSSTSLFSDDQVYKLANSYAENGFGKFFAELVLTILIDNGGKDSPQFKKAKDWAEKLGDNPKVEDVIKVIELLPDDKKKELENIIEIIEVDKGGGKKVKELKAKVKGGDGVTLNEEEVLEFAIAMDYGVEKNQIESIKAKANNSALAALNRLVGYDPNTKYITQDSLSFGGTGLKVDQSERDELNQALSLEGITLDELMNVGSTGLDNTPLLDRMKEGLKDLINSSDVEEIDNEVSTYDNANEFEFNSLENLKFYMDTLNNHHSKSISK